MIPYISVVKQRKSLPNPLFVSHSYVSSEAVHISGFPKLQRNARVSADTVEKKYYSNQTDLNSNY